MQRQLLVIHPGRGHKDEVLAAAFLLATGRIDEVYRREPTAEDLSDPNTYVVDVGGRLEPELLNFDHHQLERDAAPCCALTLVLQHLGLLEFAREMFPWFEQVELLDSKGPRVAAEALGLTPENFAKTLDPLGANVCRWVGDATVIRRGDFLFELLERVGREYTEYLHSVRERVALLAQVVREVQLPLGHTAVDVTAIERDNEPLLGLELRVRQWHPAACATVSQATRGNGVTLYRRPGYEAQIDFGRISGQPGVEFVHASGFLAQIAPGVDWLALLRAAVVV
jgi:hypothetical protein